MSDANAKRVGEVGIVQAVREGTVLSKAGGGTPGGDVFQGGPEIRHLTAATYTLTPADHNAMLVFDVAADVVVTLPKLNDAKDAAPFSCLIVNTLGRLDFTAAAGETLVAYAPHAEQGATVGMMRGAVNWYATGTNVKVEDA